MDRFGFLIHPLDMRDVIRFEPKAANKREALVEKILEWMPAYEASHVTGLKSLSGIETEGWFIAVPLLPAMFTKLPKEFVMKRIIEGGKLAEKKGAKILGLGGFTSVIGDAGITVAQNLSIAVTSGNSYTIATALEGAVEGARRLNIDMMHCRAAVVGASGAIGSVCARILARQVASIDLVARNVRRLKLLAETIEKESRIPVRIHEHVSAGIREADIVITATSSMGGIIHSQDLKPGAVVCDVALPHDVCREVAQERPDVLVIEGGLVEVPGDVDLNYDFGYPPGIALACMSETMILAMEGLLINYSLGRGIKIEQVEGISALAKKHGFKLAGLRSFDQMVTDDRVCEVRELARREWNSLRVSYGS